MFYQPHTISKAKRWRIDPLENCYFNSGGLVSLSNAGLTKGAPEPISGLVSLKRTFEDSTEGPAGKLPALEKSKSSDSCAPGSEERQNIRGRMRPECEVQDVHVLQSYMPFLQARGNELRCPPCPNEWKGHNALTPHMKRKHGLKGTKTPASDPQSTIRAISLKEVLNDRHLTVYRWDPQFVVGPAPTANRQATANSMMQPARNAAGAQTDLLSFERSAFLFQSPGPRFTMSTTRNDEAQAQKGGEFQPRVPRDEPMQTGGHQPGKLVGNDAVPEFNAQTLPAGSAPASKTFQPNVTPSAGPDQTDFEDHPAAGNMGATSADVHTGLGHPGAGQSSKELHSKTQQRQGVEGAGASSVLQSGIDTSDPKFAQHRTGPERSDEAFTGRGNVGGPPAEERIPESAESVASARN